MASITTEIVKLKCLLVLHQYNSNTNPDGFSYVADLVKIENRLKEITNLIKI